jgi:hypothetical protein
MSSTHIDHDDESAHNLAVIKNKIATLQMKLLQNTMKSLSYIMNNTTDSPEYIAIKNEMDTITTEQHRLSNKLIGYAMKKLTTKLETTVSSDVSSSSGDNSNLMMIMQGLTGIIKNKINTDTDINITDEMSDEEEEVEKEQTFALNKNDIFKTLLESMPSIIKSLTGEDDAHDSGDIDQSVDDSHESDNVNDVDDVDSIVRELEGL